MSETSIRATSVVGPSCGRRNRVAAVAEGVPTCGNCGAGLPWIATADDHDFADVAEQSGIPVLVDLWAPWCLPCRMVSPALEQLARELTGRIKLVKVNLDEVPRLSQRFEVQAVPTLLLMNRGRVVARHVGAAPAGALRSWLEHGLTDGTAR
ncbi:MAG: thioredoxin [Kineosporiaceae bacterium]